MRAITHRLCQLEDQIGSADRPRRRLRLMIMRAGARPCLEDATCTRMLCVDGSLLETVQFKKDNDGPKEPTQEEVDAWVDAFPVRVLSR
jgi:hypothetical protein